MKVAEIPAYLLRALGEQKYLGHLAYIGALNAADYDGATRVRGDWSRANLSRANLSRADLYGADLSEANLSRADLSRANLSEADLSGADLSRADLYEANLYRANLSEANLYGADLSGADLSEAVGVVQFGPVPGSGRIGYAVDHGERIMVQLGCWWNDLGATVAELQAKNRHESYVQLVQAAAACLEARR